MNESSSKQNRPWLRQAFWIWLVFLIAIGGWLAWFDLDAMRRREHMPPIWQQCLMAAGGAALALGLWCLIRWPFTSWRHFRRALVGLAVLATLIAVFYTEEDWRGKRAWENCKRELEARGVVLDWEKFIPPPVPDDQNFFKASKKIGFSFVHSRNDAEAEFYAKQVRIQTGPTESNSFPILDTAKTRAVVVAALTVIPSGATTFEPASNRLVLEFNDPDAQKKTGQFVRNTLGRSANGSQGFKFSEFQLSNLAPAQITLQADPPPSIADLENLIPTDTVTNIGHLHVKAAGGKGDYQVLLTGFRITAAADYLKWSDQYEPDFAEIREALKRPYAQIDCDYSQPYEIQIPNFVTMRWLAQTLAQRTQCYLLLGQPEKALGELTLLNDSRRILEGGPTGKPMTLVASMINVAITSVYVDTLAYGLQLHAWREPQLFALQEQLKAINLLPFVAESFREEPVYSSRTLETITPSELKKIYYSGQDRRNLLQKLDDPTYLLLMFAPRGWVYQNMKVSVTLGQYWLAGFDLTNNLILPSQAKNGIKAIEKAISSPSIGNQWARIAIPNISKALLTTAKNQTSVYEGQIACAIERYHLVHSEYPETLDALVPQFIAVLPHDIIGGQPLHYHRTDDGNFLLYSVGWNEMDDGGRSSANREQGDWVWQYPTP